MSSKVLRRLGIAIAAGCSLAGCDQPAGIVEQAEAADTTRALSVSKGVQKEFPATEVLLEEALAENKTAASSKLQVIGEIPPGIADSCAVSAGQSKESYVVKSSKDGLRVYGSSNEGAIRGIAGLHHLGNNLPPVGECWAESPALAIRALHFVTRAVSLEEARGLVDRAYLARMNTIIVQMADGIDFGVPGPKPRADAWSVAEFQEWIAYAESRGMEVIPEVKLLTHQEKFLSSHYPELMYNKVTYNPDAEGLYDLVFGYLDAVIEALNPRVLHIGHDEAGGYNKEHAEQWLADGERLLPASLYLKDISKLHAYLTERGIETWMWGDMLVSKSEPEFADMFQRHLHGTKGYANQRGKLPKDIVILDWHYFDRQEEFPTLRAFQDEGHRVLGAVWHREVTMKNFSAYASSIGADGMVLTLWSKVQQDEWDEIDGLVERAGQYFWTAGQSQSGSD